MAASTFGESTSIYAADSAKIPGYSSIDNPNKLEVTEFSHLTEEEFSKMKGLLIDPSADSNPLDFTVFESNNSSQFQRKSHLSASMYSTKPLNWCSENNDFGRSMCTPIRNQGFYYLQILSFSVR